MPRKPLNRIVASLIAHGCYLKGAARDLKMTWRELKALLEAEPELLKAAYEAEERKIDLAKQAILAGMSDPDPMKRLRAASAWLALTIDGRKRIGRLEPGQRPPEAV